MAKRISVSILVLSFSCLCLYAGVAPQGMTMNGGTINALTFNGTAYNGAWLNGAFLNGMTINALTMQGANLQGTSLEGTLIVEGVEQHRMPLAYRIGDETYNTSLAGLLLDGKLSDGRTIQLRVEDVEQDTTETLFSDARLKSNSDVFLYTVSFYDPAHYVWRELCPGDHKATFLSGSWNPAGDWNPSDDIFTIACTSGVLAKCTRWGYKPWVVATTRENQEVSLRELFLACTRAARADYCGNGVPYTKDGTMIDLWDTYGFVSKVDESQVNPAFSAEACFGTGGAGCLEKVRYESLTPECDEAQRPTRFEGSTPSSSSADPDDRIPCANRRNAEGIPQLIFTESSTYCSHPPSLSGERLYRDCSLCTRKVCASIKHCCGMDRSSNGVWDEECVAKAERICRD